MVVGRGRCHHSPVTLPSDVPRALHGVPARRRSAIGAAFTRLRPRRFSLSLARRFLLANLVILLVAGLAIGVWVGNQRELAIIDLTVSITAISVDSFIYLPAASLGTGDWLTATDT